MRALILSFLCFAAVNVPAANEPLSTLSELRTNGVFGFPQKTAKVLCDEPALRLSAWNNPEYLFVQAVMWKDDDASVGKTEDNRPIGDWSSLLLDLDADGKATANLDRNYMLNPWPSMQGLHYSTSMGEGSSTGIEKDSKGRGSIRYVQIPGGQIRVDTFLIPMAEISRHAGDNIRLAYWGRSPKPALTLNSVGYEHKVDTYYAHDIPQAAYHGLVLEGAELDFQAVPEGRNDIALSNRKKVDMPKVGDMAPEISAGEWLHLSLAPTMAALRGKVVVLEFWATWCGPCVAGLPELNSLHAKYGNAKFQLLSFVEEGHKTMDRLLARRPVRFPIGLESPTLEAYGITAIPYAFVIDPQGKIVWQGITNLEQIDKEVAAALHATK